MKIQEVLLALTERQHKLAVLEDVVGYLEEFLPSDVDEDPEEKLRVEDSMCLDPVVSTKAIEEIIDLISDLIKAEQKELNKLKTLETKPNGRTRKSPSRKPSTAKPKPSRGKK